MVTVQTICLPDWMSDADAMAGAPPGALEVAGEAASPALGSTATPPPHVRARARIRTRFMPVLSVASTRA
jgi:hypothetical protein